MESASGTTWCQYRNGLLDLHRRIKEKAYEAKPRNVIVIWGPTGMGKSRQAHAAGATPVDIVGGRFMIGYDYQDCVLLDDFDWKQVGRSYFLRLLDRYQVTIEVKGGSVLWVPSTIYITANYDPLTWYAEGNQVDLAVQRRFTSVIHQETEWIPPAEETPVSETGTQD